MIDQTPETIESIDKTAISDLKRLAAELHEATPHLLDTPNTAADLEQQMRLRTALKLKLNETLDWLAEQMADLEAIKRDVRSRKSYVTSDEDRLSSAMFTRLREEKRGNS